MENIIKKQGKNPGNISVVIAGTHGNETCGVNAFNEILPNLNITSGIVYFIYGNPKAILENKRYIEFNLNRAFKDESEYSKPEKETYEYKRAHEIKKYLDKASALLDIHSTAKSSEPFIFTEENGLEVTSKLPHDFKHIVMGVESVEPGATDGYMLNQNKIGLCVECGQHEAPHVFDLAKRTIFEFLNARGHLEKETSKDPNTAKHVKLNYSYYTKTNSFSLTRDFKDFEYIEKGVLVGTDGEEDIFAPFSGLILFARNCKKKNLEGFLMGHDISNHSL